MCVVCKLKKGIAVYDWYCVLLAAMLALVLQILQCWLQNLQTPPPDALCPPPPPPPDAHSVVPATAQTMFRMQ